MPPAVKSRGLDGLYGIKRILLSRSADELFITAFLSLDRCVAALAVLTHLCIWLTAKDDMTPVNYIYIKNRGRVVFQLQHSRVALVSGNRKIAVFFTFLLRAFRCKSNYGNKPSKNHAREKMCRKWNGEGSKSRM